MTMFLVMIYNCNSLLETVEGQSIPIGATWNGGIGRGYIQYTSRAYVHCQIDAMVSFTKALDPSESFSAQHDADRSGSASGIGKPDRRRNVFWNASRSVEKESPRLMQLTFKRGR